MPDNPQPTPTEPTPAAQPPVADPTPAAPPPAAPTTEPTSQTKTSDPLSPDTPVRIPRADGTFVNATLGDLARKYIEDPTKSPLAQADAGADGDQMKALHEAIKTGDVGSIHKLVDAYAPKPDAAVPAVDPVAPVNGDVTALQQQLDTLQKAFNDQSPIVRQVTNNARSQMLGQFIDRFKEQLPLTVKVGDGPARVQERIDKYHQLARSNNVDLDTLTTQQQMEIVKQSMVDVERDLKSVNDIFNPSSEQSGPVNDQTKRVQPPGYRRMPDGTYVHVGHEDPAPSGKVVPTDIPTPGVAGADVAAPQPAPHNKPVTRANLAEFLRSKIQE